MVFPRIGATELILIVGAVLLIFGPKKLPELGRSIGKTLREFRKSTKETDEDGAMAIPEEVKQKEGEPVKG
ncbi:MAG: twin-arginine translocase TatA/TatE family subunit [Bacillota bacterium]